MLREQKLRVWAAQLIDGLNCCEQPSHHTVGILQSLDNREEATKSSCEQKCYKGPFFGRFIGVLCHYEHPTYPICGANATDKKCMGIYIYGRDRIGCVSKRTTLLGYYFLEAHFGTLRWLTLLTQQNIICWGSEANPSHWHATGSGDLLHYAGANVCWVCWIPTLRFFPITEWVWENSSLYS